MKKMTRRTVVGAIAIVLSIPAGAAVAADAEPDSTLQIQPAVQILATSADTSASSRSVGSEDGQLTLEGLDQVEYPWYAAVQEDGVGRFTWGPGLDADDPAGFEAQITATDVTILAGTCTLLVDNVSRPSQNLRSNTLVTCVGDPAGGIQTQAHFRRSSWSGFRDYTNVTTSVLTASQTQDIAWNAYCGGGTPGTYDYQFRARGITGTYGTSAWFASVTANTFPCGTGVS